MEKCVAVSRISDDASRKKKDALVSEVQNISFPAEAHGNVILQQQSRSGLPIGKPGPSSLGKLRARRLQRWIGHSGKCRYIYLFFIFFYFFALFLKLPVGACWPPQRGEPGRRLCVEAYRV